MAKNLYCSLLFTWRCSYLKRIKEMISRTSTSSRAFLKIFLLSFLTSRYTSRALHFQPNRKHYLNLYIYAYELLIGKLLSWKCPDRINCSTLTVSPANTLVFLCTSGYSANKILWKTHLIFGKPKRSRSTYPDKVIGFTKYHPYFYHSKNLDYVQIN